MRRRYAPTMCADYERRPGSPTRSADYERRLRADLCAAHRAYIVHTSCKHRAHIVHTERTLSAHRAHTERTQSAHRAHTERTQSVHRAYTECAHRAQSAHIGHSRLCPPFVACSRTSRLLTPVAITNLLLSGLRAQHNYQKSTFS